MWSMASLALFDEIFDGHEPEESKKPLGGVWCETNGHGLT